GVDGCVFLRIGADRGTVRGAQQRLVRLPFARSIERLEKRNLSAREQRKRHAVAVEHAIAGERSEPRPGRENADEVERVGPAERDEGARILTAPDFTKHADRLRHRELLTGKAGYEPAPADFAARLQPAKDAEQIAPRRQPIRLALEQAPEHDAVAPQQRARRVLDRLRSHLCASLRRSAPGERPSTRVLDAEERRAPPAA